MASPFTYSQTKPLSGDALNAFPAFVQGQWQALGAAGQLGVLGTLLPFGTPTTGWRDTQDSNKHYLSWNAYLSGAGGTWSRDDTTVESWLLQAVVNANQFELYWAAGAAGTITWLPVAKFQSIAAVANYFNFLAAAAGSAPAWQVVGTDLNISALVTPKGAGSFQVTGLFQSDGANAGRVNTGGLGTPNRTRMLQSMAQVIQNAPQSIPVNTLTALSFNVANVNTDTVWAAANPTRLTAQVAGKYLVKGAVHFATYTPNDVNYIYIRKNGLTQVSSRPVVYYTIGRDWAFEVTDIVPLVASDYVEIMVLQNSAGAVNTSGDLGTSALMLYVGE